MNDVGNKKEELLHSIIAEPLLLGLVHLRPSIRSGGQQRELCDILIEDSPIALIIQIKAQSDNDKGKEKLERWVNKKISEASKQVCGALRFLHISDIHINNEVRGDFIIQRGELQGRHGIVVVDYTGSPLPINGNISRRSDTGVPLHYLSTSDFANLCNFLKSLPDLIKYLEERSKISAWATPRLNDERNVYAYYIQNEGRFHSAIRPEDFEKCWEYLTVKNKDKYIDKLREDELAELFNAMLSEAHELDSKMGEYIPLNLQGRLAKTHHDSVRIVRLFNKMPTIQRREVVKRLIDKAKLAESSKRGFHYFCVKHDSLKIYYVFATSRLDRRERFKKLMILVDCINNITDADFVVGLATDNFGSKDSYSNDFIFLEGTSKSQDSNVIENCKKFFKTPNYETCYDFPSDKPKILLPD